MTLFSGTLQAKIGASEEENVKFIMHSATEQGLLFKDLVTRYGYDTCLTMDGWKKFQKLQRKVKTSRTAFMAMPFRYDNVTQMVDTVFRPAVAETGFTLKRVDDAPKAGSIDDRMRVEIRMCRFLIADLTYGNQGAYWEAGYAEGLGKKVIYTCEETFFDEKKTHFDTNHHQTVVWDSAEPDKAAEQLKATIRATLPFEAKMPKE